ncbi:MAG: hypothetical protein A2Y58_06070 [Chloroflexi bacterium RBG_13_51_52]|nr:MAG: hypothetical protein A2Y58_06070 [Chloroflexi bacterium RBG_13_51_52]
MLENIQNAIELENELAWFRYVLEERIRIYFNPDSTETVIEVPMPSIDNGTWYGRFIDRYNFSPPERLVLMLALAPEIKPQLLDIFFTRNKLFDRGFTEFGGIQGQRHGGFIPTVQTALFILAGEEIEPYLSCSRFFEHAHPFSRDGILELDSTKDNEPFTSVPLRLSRDTFSLITRGRNSEPEYSENFPAKKLETLMDWEDLVLPKQIMDELSELIVWMKHGEAIRHDWNLEKRIRPGYTALFYGPPGTGKTLSATLLGKQAQRAVYRIDLSQLVSSPVICALTLMMPLYGDSSPSSTSLCRKRKSV